MLNTLIISTLILTTPSNFIKHTKVIILITIGFIFLLKESNSIFFAPLSNNLLFIDSLSSNLILLTIWIFILIIIVRNKIIARLNQNINLFITTCLILIVILILTFSTNNILSFYILFEASALPTMILIIIWGYQPERLQARFYLILYTVLRSLPLLIVIISILKTNNSLYINEQTFNLTFSRNMSINVIVALCITSAFLVKLPIYYIHIWLPKAHVEAPLAGSIVLAAILLKLGGYGLIRIFFNYPCLSYPFFKFILPLSLIGAIFTRFICTRQTDLKSLIAYSSVAHIGVILAALSSFQTMAWNGAIIMLYGHGLGSSLLFCLAAFSYEKSGSRRLILTKGILKLSPILALFWFIGAILRIGAPPFINLAAEIFIAQRIIIKNFIIVPILIVIIFISLLYSLILYTSTRHGPLIEFSKKHLESPQSNQLRNTAHFIPAFLLLFSIKYIFI